MNSRGKYLIKNTAIFALSNIGTKIINFFLVPLYTYVLTNEQYGTTDLIFTISSFLAPILILNINEAIMRFALDKNADDNKLLSIGLVTVGASAVIGLLLIPLVDCYPPLAIYKYYVYLYTISYGATDIFLCYLRGKEQLLEFSIGNIIRTTAIALFNIAFLMKFKMGIKGYLVAYISANVITSLYSIVVGNVGRTLKKFAFDRALYNQMIRYSVFLIPTSFMRWIINSSDRIMITYFMGLSVSGLYAVSSKIPSLVSTISTIFNQAYSYSAIKENESKDRNEYNNKIFHYLFISVSISGITLLAVIKGFIRFYVSPEYYEAWICTPPLIAGTCILILATFFSVSYTVNKDSVGFMKSGAIGTLINVLLNFVLIPQIGSMGAALATAASYVAVFMYRYFDIQKYIKLKVFTKKHNVSLVCLLASSIFVYCPNYIYYTADLCLLIVVIAIYWNELVNIFKSVIRTKGLK